MSATPRKVSRQAIQVRAGKYLYCPSRRTASVIVVVVVVVQGSTAQRSTAQYGPG